MCRENLKDVSSNFQIIIMIYLKMRLVIIMGNEWTEQLTNKMCLGKMFTAIKI